LDVFWRDAGVFIIGFEVHSKDLLGFPMKLSLAAMVTWFGLSLIGCGGPALDDTTGPEAEAQTVSAFGTCTPGLPSCSLYVNLRCTTPGATKECCNTTSQTPNSLICSGSASTGYRWLNY
jgi:hypothetical protein